MNQQMDAVILGLVAVGLIALVAVRGAYRLGFVPGGPGGTNTSQRCTECNRWLYTDRTLEKVMKPYLSGPFYSFTRQSSIEMHRDWGWQSWWSPELCRFCDTEHDHRRRPMITSPVEAVILGVIAVCLIGLLFWAVVLA